MEEEVIMMDIDENEPRLPALTGGSATAIAQDEYVNEILREERRRLTMQVVDVALLKYSLDHFRWDKEADNSVGPLTHDDFPRLNFAPPTRPIPQTPREMFEKGRGICFLDFKGMAKLPWPYRYRLQLSDGQHFSPAKFYPENAPQDMGQTEVTCLKSVQKLIKSDRLRKGSIIEFTPNSHVVTGKGIVTVFDVKVVGFSKECIGDPQPCHPGALSYSPHGAHHCTVPMDLVQRNGRLPDPPLPRPILRLAKLIEEKLGYCVISGSSALAQHLHDLPGCHHCYASLYSPSIVDIIANNASNDVDLFVPLYPEKLNHFYNTGEKIAYHGTVFGRNALLEVLEELYERYGLSYTDVQDTKIRLSGVEDGGEDYGWLRIFVGLKEKLEFKLVSEAGHVIDRPIQILIMDAFPATQDETWSNVVTKGFDTDIIMGVAELDVSAKLQKITFPEQAKDSIESGSFNYIMRPCHSFPQMLKRLNKYAQRRFRLASFEFDSRVSKEWREHILLQFQRKYARLWMGQWWAATNMFMPPEIESRIMEFLEGNRPEEEVQRENRDMLRNMIRTELQRTGGYDPGHIHINMELLEHTWGHSDGETANAE